MVKESTHRAVGIPSVGCGKSISKRERKATEARGEREKTKRSSRP